MARPRTLPTPMSWASGAGIALIPAFLALGLVLGIVARGWMRFIANDPEFTWGGTLGIVIGFAVFAVTQSVAALAAERPWNTWPRRAARCVGVVGLLPLFAGAGVIMAPAVILAGLAVWHPSWPRVIRGILALVALANVIAVASTITADFGMSLRSLVGACGLLLVYASIVWTAAGTFSPPRATTPAPATA